MCRTVSSRALTPRRRSATTAAQCCTASFGRDSSVKVSGRMKCIIFALRRHIPEGRGGTKQVHGLRSDMTSEITQRAISAFKSTRLLVSNIHMFLGLDIKKRI